MDDDRMPGCLPGETPTSILLFQQERRHREELTRLRAELAEAKGSIKYLNDIADDLRRIAEYRGAGLSIAAAALSEARALVEKREAQMEWMTKAQFGRVGYLRGGHLEWYWDLEWKRAKYDSTRAGLLAAIDEATKIQMHSTPLCPQQADQLAEVENRDRPAPVDIEPAGVG